MSKSLFEIVSKEIEAEINSCTVGTKLPSERELAIKYGVSRNILREVMRSFSEKGIVQIISGKGTYVADLMSQKFTQNLETILLSNESTLQDIVEVRESLETAIFIKLMETATEADFEKFDEIYDKLEKSRSNISQYIYYDIEFHISLAKATKNSVYPLLVSSLYEISDKKLFLLTQLYPLRIDSAQEEHKGLLQAIKNKDEAALREIAHYHFNISDFFDGAYSEKNGVTMKYK